jgi:bifunctional DNA-binding transcriptional regulator/antitoxin component of YhaV-PrlF toxin-antitoxin module|tara:strand:+ start:4511 stop:4858 length:348 start_codon:yes stop_codon:yes gene_type:complete
LSSGLQVSSPWAVWAELRYSYFVLTGVLDMETAQLSSKGQLVLPQRVRNAHGWAAGTVFEVKELPEGVLLSPLSSAPVFAPTRLDDVFGIAKGKGRRLSLKQMDEAVQMEAARRR